MMTSSLSSSLHSIPCVSCFWLLFFSVVLPRGIVISIVVTLGNEAILLSSAKEIDKTTVAVILKEQTKVMVSQILTEMDVEGSDNATEAIVACCRKVGCSFTESALQIIVEQWRQALQQTTATNNRATQKQSSTICYDVTVLWWTL
jgi:hypothetical protein